MEIYKKPIMKIVELEKVDVLTTSCEIKGHVDDNLNGYCDRCGIEMLTDQQ